VAGEQLISERLHTGPSHDDFGGGTATATRSGRVEVIHGVYAHSLPLAGMTVRQARTELEERMNIDPEALAVVDGQETTEDSVLREGQVLNFLTPAGEKG
jgi:hypothetical protein